MYYQSGNRYCKLPSERDKHCHSLYVLCLVIWSVSVGVVLRRLSLNYKNELKVVPLGLKKVTKLTQFDLSIISALWICNAIVTDYRVSI